MGTATEPMTIERAKEIVGRMLDVRYAAMGIPGRTFPEPLDCSLAEMVEANRIVAEFREPTENGYRTLGMHCADRLIAAIYTLWHYDPDREPIAWIPHGRVAKCVAVCTAELPDEDNEESEDE